MVLRVDFKWQRYDARCDENRNYDIFTDLDIHDDKYYDDDDNDDTGEDDD